MQHIIKDIESMENDFLLECLDSMQQAIGHFERSIDAIQTGDPEECNLARMLLKKIVAKVPNEVLDFLFTALHGQHREWIMQMQAEVLRRGL